LSLHGEFQSNDLISRLERCRDWGSLQRSPYAEVGFVTLLGGGRGHGGTGRKGPRDHGGCPYFQTIW
ncbi:hypothetical protein BAE44_0025922, partial [Dichanthelium oligosanthes]